ncbi:MAG: adenylate kinase [Anaerolineales bacterium]|jgi:adenylate kinase|nr:adenylate kinase [Anaerolineales bacterium]
MLKCIVLLGPPGAGKGTQAQLVAEKLGSVHISSGDLFREHLRNNSELGQQARSYIDRGELVPDDLTISMVRERLSLEDCQSGALLDGFPRTPAQAEALADVLEDLDGEVSSVPYISVSTEVLIARLSGRWTCKEAGHIYHELHNPPKTAGICDYDGSELYQREDDKVETVKRRIQVYLNQTEPLIEYYRDRGLLVEVEGDQPINEVTESLLMALNASENL